MNASGFPPGRCDAATASGAYTPVKKNIDGIPSFAYTEKSSLAVMAGMRVVVTQQIPQRQRDWTTTATGTVVKLEQAKTGSWFAHSKNDKLWLDRLKVRKDDGELTTLNLDEYSHVEIVEAAPAVKE